MAVLLAVCPYFLGEHPDRMTVACQGATLRFPDRRARLCWLVSYCASFRGYHECQLCRMLDDAYRRSMDSDVQNVSNSGCKASEREEAPIMPPDGKAAHKQNLPPCWKAGEQASETPAKGEFDQLRLGDDDITVSRHE